jgi:hypothetical protein
MFDGRLYHPVAVVVVVADEEEEKSDLILVD